MPLPSKKLVLLQFLRELMQHQYRNKVDFLAVKCVLSIKFAYIKHYYFHEERKERSPFSTNNLHSLPCKL